MQPTIFTRYALPVIVPGVGQPNAPGPAILARALNTPKRVCVRCQFDDNDFSTDPNAVRQGSSANAFQGRSEQQYVFILAPKQTLYGSSQLATNQVSLSVSDLAYPARRPNRLPEPTFFSRVRVGLRPQILCTAREEPVRVLINSGFVGNDIIVNTEQNDLDTSNLGYRFFTDGVIKNETFILAPGQRLYGKAVGGDIGAFLNVSVSEGYLVNGTLQF
jgi:hypothetical protein